MTTYTRKEVFYIIKNKATVKKFQKIEIQKIIL